MFFRLILFILIGCFSCSKGKEKFPSLVVGHAGMGLDVPNSIFPPNSFSAFSSALLLGANGIECDVRMDNDGLLWCFHDELLDNSTNGEGCIETKSFTELAKINYKGFGSHSLTRLSDLIEQIDTSDYLFIDVKHWNPCKSVSIVQFKNALLTLGIHFREKTYLIISNEVWLNELITDFKVIFDISSNFGNELSLLEGKVNGWCVNTKLVTTDWIQYWNNKGKLTVLSEMKSAKTIKKSLEKRPFAIITDDVRSSINIKKHN
jgi:glycerophosphoryl diester phosphodiesterase